MKKMLLLLLLFSFSITSFSQAKKKLLGYWYKPKTMVNVRFYPNNTFEYSDYDTLKNSSDTLTGRYKLKRNTLTLQFADNTTQTFNFAKEKTGNRNYYLKQNDNYFIKDERVNNAVPPDNGTQKQN
jgi:hypothetical protein